MISLDLATIEDISTELWERQESYFLGAADPGTNELSVFHNLTDWQLLGLAGWCINEVRQRPQRKEEL